jgi:hypothetical protein
MSSLGIIQDGAMLIVDGIIRHVGPGRRVERLAEARGAEEVDAVVGLARKLKIRIWNE